MPPNDYGLKEIYYIVYTLSHQFRGRLTRRMRNVRTNTSPSPTEWEMLYILSDAGQCD